MDLCSGLLLTVLIAFCQSQEVPSQCLGEDGVDHLTITCTNISDISTLTDFLTSVTQTIGDITISDSPELHLQWENLNIPALQDIKEVNLRNNNITSFNSESFHPQNLHSVQLSDNNLKSINATTFQGLTAIKNLFLYSNEIDSIHNSAFKNLTHLEILHLSDNKLTAIDANLFEGLPVNELLLAYNDLTSIEERSFHGLDKLFRLVLSHNKITTIDSRAFQTLTDLETVELSNNELQSLDGRLFENTKLQALDLSNNDLETITNYHLNSSTLRALRLSDCNIHTIPEDYFANLPNLLGLLIDQNKIDRVEDNLFTPLAELRVLRFTENNLTSLSIETFQQFHKIIQQSPITVEFEKSSKTVERILTFHANPWDCGSEDMINLRAWTVKHDVDFDDLFEICKV